MGLNRPLRHTKLEQLSGKHLTPLISTYFQEACAEWNKHSEDSQDYGFGYGVIDKLQGCDQRDTEGNPLPGADLSFWGRFGAFVQAIAGIFRA